PTHSSSASSTSAWYEAGSAGVAPAAPARAGGGRPSIPLALAAGGRGPWPCDDRGHRGGQREPGRRARSLPGRPAGLGDLGPPAARTDARAAGALVDVGGRRGRVRHG